jgi:predicted nuclease with TOPRIM domain
MEWLFNRSRVKRQIEKYQQEIDTEVVNELKQIALGHSPMTDSMRQLLDLMPDIKTRWQQFETKKEELLNSIDGTPSRAHPRNHLKK